MTTCDAQLGPCLLDHLRAFVASQPPENVLALKSFLTSREDDAEPVLRAWVEQWPEDLKRPFPRGEHYKPLYLLAPLLAWGCDEPWHKAIDWDTVDLRWTVYLQSKNRVSLVDASHLCTRMLAQLMDTFSRLAQARLLAYWLDGERAIWTPDRLQQSTMLVSAQAGTWEALGSMASAFSGKKKAASPSARWSANLRACMDPMPPSVQGLYVEHFFDSAMTHVDKVRAARCAHPVVWERLAHKIVPLLPNNERSRYDLIPMADPAQKLWNRLTEEGAGKLNRTLAGIYAPGLTMALREVASDADWAHPSTMRALVERAYLHEKGRGAPPPDVLELDGSVEGLFL